MDETRAGGHWRLKSRVFTFFGHHPVGSKLSAAAIGFLTATLYYGFGLDSMAKDFFRRQSVTFETPREPKEKGLQDIIVTFKRSLSPDEKVQVWIQEGDLRWYKCLNVRPLSVAAAAWEATCPFGKPGSPNPNDWAKHGVKFPVAAFVWKTELRDNAGLWPEIWDALRIDIAKRDIEYKGY
jgi:hypothetical protein